jgi:hypothetical protein
LDSLPFEKSGVGGFFEDFGKDQASDVEDSRQSLACRTFDR